MKKIFTVCAAAAMLAACAKEAPQAPIMAFFHQLKMPGRWK